MSSDEEFLKRLHGAFLEEGAELLAAISNRISEIENSDNHDQIIKLLGKVLSSLHSLKGSARAVNESELVAICQNMEGAFGRIKQQNEETMPRVLALELPVLLEIVDTMSEFFDMDAGIAGDGTGLSEIEKSGLRGAVDIKLGALEKKLEIAAPDKPISLDNPVSTEKPDLSQVQTGTFNVTELRSMLSSMREDQLTKDDKADSGEKPSVAISKPTRTEESQTVRVPMDRLDKLLLESEELLVLRGQMADRLGHLNELRSIMRELARQSKQSQSPLAAEIERAYKQVASMSRVQVRENSASALMLSRFSDTAKTLTLQPISTALEVFPRVVRDLSRELHKEADITIDGGHLEIDRRVLEKLKEPLMHILRNALDHGIETPDEREARGKPRKARLKLNVKQLSVDNLEITVTDDGAGVNAGKVREKAVQQNIITQEEAKQLSYAQTLALIFRPDFSTREEVSEVSGRGLGLAIVKEKIEELSGRLEIQSTLHEGTTFKIILPTKMAAFGGIKLEAQGQAFVMPVSGLVRALRVHPLAMEIVEGRRTFFVDGKLIPVATLAQALGLPAREEEEKHTRFKYLEMLVMQSREKTAGILVDHVLDQGEFLVKKLGFPLDKLSNFAGATILSGGQPALVLNNHDLVESVHNIKTLPAQGSTSLLSGLLDSMESKQNYNREIDQDKTILIVEDSITSRVLLKNIFESAGYTVRMATDGEEGLKQLRRIKPALVVSDVEMPNLDGLGMTLAIRQDPFLMDLPVILITSLASEADRAAGIAAGANGYFVKGDINQTGLLDLVRKLT